MFNTTRFAIAATLAGFIVPALANPLYDDGKQVIAHVPVSDLDLTSGAGQTTLEKRVQKAARQVCAAVSDGGTMVDPDFKKCYTQAFAGGWRQAETKIAAAQATQSFASANH